MEEPLLPVLLLLSDIALFRLNAAQHGADSAFWYSADDDRNNVSFTEHALMHTQDVLWEFTE